VPNGSDRDFIRFISCIASFKAKFNSWPAKIRLNPWFIAELQKVMGIEDYQKLTNKITLIADPIYPADGTYIAEDDQGNALDLLVSGHLDNRVNVIDWLGIEWPDYKNTFKGEIILGIDNW